MTPNDWIQLVLYFVVLALLAQPVGWYMARVYEGKAMRIGRCTSRHKSERSEQDLVRRDTLIES
jgi:K+-transporting ATPase A subunit